MLYWKITTESIRPLLKNPVVWILLALAAFSCSIRLYILCESPYAFGADGYYYAAQIRYYFEEGYFFTADSSLFLYFLTYASLLGKNPVLTNKIATAVLSSSLLFPAYLIGKNLSNRKGGLLYGSFILANSLASYFIFEYVKNLGGIFFFLFFLHQLLLAMTHPEKKKYHTGLYVFYVLVFFTHKLMAVLATLLLATYLLYLLKKRWMTITVISIALLLFTGISGYFFPNTLHLADFSRLRTFFSFIPQWAPLSYIQTRNLPLILSIEILSISLTPLLLIYNWKHLSSPKQFFLAIMLGLYCLMIFPFFKFKGDDLAFRIFILLFIPSGMFLTLFLSRQKKLLVGLVLLLLVPYQWVLLNLAQHSFSQLDYDLYNDLLPLLHLPKHSLLIVHQGFDYFYCYNRKGDAFHFMPEKKHMNRPLYRLTYGVPPSLIKQYYPEQSSIQFLPGPYTLMKECTWQKFLKKIPAEKAREFKTWRNPYIYRPAYMLRNEKFLKLEQP